MQFDIESKKTIKYDTAFWNPEVTVFLDQVKVKFGSSGITMYFDSSLEAISVLNNIIIQIKGKEK